MSARTVTPAAGAPYAAVPRYDGYLVVDRAGVVVEGGDAGTYLSALAALTIADELNERARAELDGAGVIA